jgi:hypothetical protein
VTAPATAPTANMPNSGIVVITSGMPSPTAAISHHTHASTVFIVGVGTPAAAVPQAMTLPKWP